MINFFILSINFDGTHALACDLAVLIGMSGGSCIGIWSGDVLLEGGLGFCPGIGPLRLMMILLMGLALYQIDMSKKV